MAAAPAPLGVNPLWLPRGHLTKWGLHVEHNPGRGAGAFTGGGWKLTWHITVSRWESVDAMVQVLKDKDAESHFVMGGRAGQEHPTVVQLLPLNEAGRALQHTFGPETNRANTIQIEICAEPGRALRAAGESADARDLFALPDLDRDELESRGTDELCIPEGATRAFQSGVASWSDSTYRALANLAVLIEHRVDIPRRVPRSFTDTNRFTPGGYVRVQGHHGHCHVPGNDHIDPTTAFKGARLLRFMRSAPNNL